MTVAVALVAGTLIGLALGALGGGGSILAVPVLVYLLGQTPAQATTGSLVVVGVSAVIGAVTARRAGTVLLARGLGFGLTAVAGAALGAVAATRVAPAVLMAAFAVLMLVVGVVMIARRRRADGGDRATEPALTPIVAFAPRFVCACPRALRVLVTATGVGLLTGFLGVGGGFLVVPALVVALAVPVRYAAGTSLVVIAVTSTAALVVRLGHSVTAPDWGLVALLSAAAAAAAVAGTHLAGRVRASTLTTAFAVLVLGVAVYTGVRAAPALL